LWHFIETFCVFNPYPETFGVFSDDGDVVLKPISHGLNRGMETEKYRNYIVFQNGYLLDPLAG